MISDKLNCSIYVSTNLSVPELARIVANFLPKKDDILDAGVHRSTVRGSDFEADVLLNEDSDLSLRQLFPDGFLHFEKKVEIYVDDGDGSVSARSMSEHIGALLRALWMQGFPSVASCDYEDRLPNHGGFNDRTLPWPT